MDLTDKQLHTLRHMLGINDPVKRPEPYRNYAAVNPDDPEYLELERLGMVVNKGKSPFGQYDLYVCTEDGKTTVIKSHQMIRFPKARRRYIAFLNTRDCCPDLTFREFLVSPEYKEIREAV
jgi:hypothetical protein